MSVNFGATVTVMISGPSSSDISTSFFGSSSSVDNIFAARLSSPSSPAQQAAKLSIGAAEREINRIRGYKIQLTPADNKRLADIQERIQAIETKAAEGTARQDEIEERSELFREADEIIGKPSADVETDDVLAELRGQIDDLLAPKLDRVRANRLETLENLKTSLEEQIDEGGNQFLLDQFQNVVRQIDNLAPPRQIHELSQSERIAYDDLVDQVNNHANAKLVLNSRESIRVFNLEQTIQDLTASLPPDTSGQPTAADVSRAYSRLG